MRFAKFASRNPVFTFVAGASVLTVSSGVALIVHGTIVGKTYSSTPDQFLFKEFTTLLSGEQIAALKAEASRILTDGAAKRYNFNPGKAGAAVSFGSLQKISPQLCSFYEGFAAKVGEQLKLTLCPTPSTDNSSLSLLVYSKEGDHIDWHYDLNFYRGRHFTVLVPLIVEGPVDAQLQVALPRGAERCWRPGLAGEPVRHASASQETVQAILGSSIVKASGNEFPQATIEAVPTEVGAVVVFEGAKVFHRVTPLGASKEAWKTSWTPPPSSPNGSKEALQPGSHEGPLRVVLSMTFTTDPSSSLLCRFQRRLKDMTYFGLIQAILG